jgi:hypothetical protein
MTRRSLFLTIAAGLLVSGISALDARAGNVPLPTLYSNLIGNSTVVVGAETLTFSGFTYSAVSSPPGSAPPASSFEVTPYTVGNETGFSLNGTLFAPAGTLVDVSIGYVVTAPAGELLTDAYLSTTGGNFGGTGTYSVAETLVNASTLVPITTMEASSPGVPTVLATFAGVSSIIVSKDIFLSGGSAGETLSVITQAFSSSGSVPEPTSMALLGIGMTGFLAFRRFFKRPSAA